MRASVLALLCLLSLGGAQVLPPVPVAAQAAGQPSTPPGPGSTGQGPGGPGGAAAGGATCSQLASALKLAPNLTYFPRLASEADRCGQSATPATTPPTCSQLRAVVDALPLFQSFKGVSHVLTLCGGQHGQPQGQTASPAFSDLHGYGWAASAIGQLARRGIFRGVGAHRFDPAGPLTRAQFATLLQRTFHLQAPATPTNFTDVQPSDWFYAAVEAAAPYMHVAAGGSFAPQQAITRIEAAAALGSILVTEGTPLDSSQQTQQVWAGFSDGGQVPPAIAADAATAVTAKLVVGEGASFGVNGQLNRAQAAVLFLRVVEQSPSASVNPAPGTGGGTNGNGGTTTSMQSCTSTSSGAACGTPAVWPGTPVSRTAIPIGDGKVSTHPEVGYVDSCTTQFRGGGARHAGPWMDAATNTWNATTKLAVQGSVSWPQASHSFTIQGDSRVITTNDLPLGFPTGIFPISPTDPAYQYDTNPNHIKPQSLSYTLPLHPTAATAPSCLGLGPIGVLINGVALFNALDASGRDAGAHEIQDVCDGHPQHRGIYHYHFISSCLLAKAKGRSTLIGYALDGYGIYVERDAQGNLPTNADLGVCHGRTSMVMWDGKETVMYHYDATLEYPYTVGCYHGTPVVSPPGGAGGAGGPGGPGGPGGGRP